MPTYDMKPDAGDCQRESYLVGEHADGLAVRPTLSAPTQRLLCLGNWALALSTSPSDCSFVSSMIKSNLNYRVFLSSVSHSSKLWKLGVVENPWICSWPGRRVGNLVTPFVVDICNVLWDWALKLWGLYDLQVFMSELNCKILSWCQGTREILENHIQKKNPKMEF